jgi:hydrogenase maturation protein HypF
VWLEDARGQALDPAALGAEDAIAAASRLLAQGRILALKGIGGFHLACDAANTRAVAELRRRKRRDAKPLALMARDLDVVRAYCRVTDREADLLRAPAAPILLLERLGVGQRPRAARPRHAPGPRCRPGPGDAWA